MLHAANPLLGAQHASSHAFSGRVELATAARKAILKIQDHRP